MVVAVDDERPEIAEAQHPGARLRPARAASRHPQPPAPQVPDLGKYEGGEYDDNYRHRMMVNLAALGFTAVLAVAGIWLVIQLADLRKNQDCVLSGRRNCAPIDVKALER